jgi:hypothetical protein
MAAVTDAMPRHGRDDSVPTGGPTGAINRAPTGRRPYRDGTTLILPVTTFTHRHDVVAAS